MIEEIWYIANDGTRFGDEDECREYEESLSANALSGKIFFWDDDMNQIPLSSQTLGRIFYVYVKDCSAVPYACEIFRENCADDPWTDAPPENDTLYYYDDLHDDWRIYDHDTVKKLWDMVNTVVGAPVYKEPRIRELLDKALWCISDLTSSGDPEEVLYLFMQRIDMTTEEIRDCGYENLLEEEA